MKGFTQAGVCKAIMLTQHTYGSELNPGWLILSRIALSGNKLRLDQSGLDHLC